MGKMKVKSEKTVEEGEASRRERRRREGLKMEVEGTETTSFLSVGVLDKKLPEQEKWGALLEHLPPFFPFIYKIGFFSFSFFAHTIFYLLM